MMNRALIALSVTLVTACGSVSSTTSKADEPTIDQVTPDHGPTPGGATITVTGKNFSGGSPIVVVGGKTATNVMAMSDSMLSFTLPAGDQEGAVVDITVANEKGFGVKEQALTYNLRPVIIGVTPSIGKGAGGTMITITGRGFQAAEAGMTTVTIAGGTATNVTVVDDKTITALTGAIAAGTKPFTPTDLVVTNTNGSATLKNGFKVTTHGLLVIGNSSRVFHVDLATGTVTDIGTVSNSPAFSSVHACAVNVAGQLFAVAHSQGTRVASLVRWDPLTGDVTAVGAMTDTTATPQNHNVSALVFIGANLYGSNTTGGVNAATNRMVQIDPTTGTVLQVTGGAAMAVNQHNALALKDAATAYIVDIATQSLDTVTLATSVVNTGLPLTGSSAAFQVRGLVNIAGTLYLIESANPSNLYTVATATGVMTKIASVNASINSMCETPSSF
ncbi:MAG: hypothetical protein JWO36_758 [Myxococcales bacterium]|nr:hypothetical protein [Myxococcales bacterium]